MISSHSMLSTFLYSLILMKTKKYTRKYNGKRYTRKRYNGKRYTRKKNNGKRYTVKRYRKNKKGGTPRVWSQMSRANQSLCIKKVPEDLRNLGNECYKYGDRKLWIRSKYDMNDVTDELAPLRIFNETDMKNYASLEDGIHNFMLFWDDSEQKYTLVTAYFNAFEFGTKHNMLSLRTIDKTPDTFIISGEIKKEGNSIHFHDTSSQYFRQECNIKRQAPIIYLYDLINKMHAEIDEEGDIVEYEGEKSIFDMIKSEILKNNTFNAEFKVKLSTIQTLPDLKTLMLSSFPIGKKEDSVIYMNYIDLIKTILADAFFRIFGIQIQVEYVSKFEEAEYNERGQKNAETMINKLCPAIPFEVYDVKKNCESKDAIEREKNKLDYTSCEIPISSSPKAKRPRNK